MSLAAEAYELFIQNYPRSEHLSVARRRLDRRLDRGVEEGPGQALHLQVELLAGNTGGGVDRQHQVGRGRHRSRAGHAGRRPTSSARTRRASPSSTPFT